MRILVRRIGVPLPFVQISEAVLIGVLIENVSVFDGQMILLEPLIWNRSMHLRVLKCSRHAVCADEMFLRNEKSRARAGPPLGRVLELLGGMIEFHRDWRRQCTFSPPRFLSHKAVAE